MTKIEDMPIEQLAALIRAYVTESGHSWSIIAAANLAAHSEMVLWKIRDCIDKDGWIWWRKVAAKVDRSGWSSGEQAMIRLGCSLAREVPEGADEKAWSLGMMLLPLDAGNARIAVEAVRYAALGPKQVRRPVVDSNSTRSGRNLANGNDTTWSGWALTDREALLEQLDRAGVSLRHEVVVCDHVTLAYPDTARPTPVQATVVGIASDEDIQALIVEIDGRHVRPDGSTYHVTLTRRPDVPDRASNAMLLRAWDEGTVTWFAPMPIPTVPILRRTTEDT